MAARTPAQSINGMILQDEHNLTVVRVWGTHEERGFAVGYLLADKIQDIMSNYLHPAFGPFLDLAKMIIQHPAYFVIDPDYVAEAMAMAEGVKAAGYMPGIDFADILLGNSFLDFQNLALGKSLVEPPGCSSLMSWGDATKGTEINGKSMITRHMDWIAAPPLVRNQVMIIHIPSEKDQQPWLLIGFAAQMSVLSGTNLSGLTLMHQMMDDELSPGIPGSSYTPIWFAMRKILEKKDINGDNRNDVQDVVSYFSQDFNGVADGFNIVAMARSKPGDYKNIALVAELAPVDPKVTFRYQHPDDGIPGDNLYAANEQIGRNNAMNICDRYAGIMENIGDGRGIGKMESWELMKQYSLQPHRNLNVIQIVPEDHYLRIGVHQVDGPNAANAPFIEFNTNMLFRPPASALSSLLGNRPGFIPGNIHQKKGVNQKNAEVAGIIPADDLLVFPNPANDQLHVGLNNPGIGKLRLELFNLSGQRVFYREYLLQEGQAFLESLDVSSLEKGIYILKINTDSSAIQRQLSLIR